MYSHVTALFRAGSPRRPLGPSLCGVDIEIFLQLLDLSRFVALQVEGRRIVEIMMRRTTRLSTWCYYPSSICSRQKLSYLPVSHPRTVSSLVPPYSPVSTALPSDAFQLLPSRKKAGKPEDELFEQQVRDVKQWWETPRYNGIKRPYTPEDVVSKRGSLQQTYPSSVMARKLFNLLEGRAMAGQPVHTSNILFSAFVAGS